MLTVVGLLLRTLTLQYTLLEAQGQGCNASSAFYSEFRYTWAPTVLKILEQNRLALPLTFLGRRTPIAGPKGHRIKITHSIASFPLCLI